MKVVTIVGARPQFIKAAPLSRALRQADITEYLVDSGQHYDKNMAGNFFSELNLPRPSHSLNIGSGPHGQMTGRMLEKVENVLVELDPDAVIVYGDTNTTIAGALASAKLNLPVVHVEAGLRSWRHTMPEEINRRLTDHISRILLCPSAQAIKNLKSEGIADPDMSEAVLGETECALLTLQDRPLAVNVGDIMVDSLMLVRDKDIPFPVVDELRPGGYVLVTLHRAESTDDPEVFKALMCNICDLSQAETVLFPVHPRTKGRLEQLGLQALLDQPGIVQLDPLPYGQFVKAQANAKVVITDSGGIQKEACMLDTPCLTLREETEWVETIEIGANRLLGTNPAPLRDIVAELKARPASSQPNLFGDGRTAQRIAGLLQSCFG